MRYGFVHHSSGALHYLQGGSGSPIVLLHQSPSASGIYQPLFPLLEPHHTVTAFDLPGYGSSDPLHEPVSIETIATAIAEGMDRLGQTSAVLSGVHTGAAIAIEIAVSRPDLVRRLVLFGVPDYVDEEGRAARRVSLVPRVISPTGDHLTDIWNRYLNRSPDLDPVHIQQRLIEEVQSSTGSAATNRALTNYDLRNRLPLLTAPTLILAGTKDRFYMESVGVAVRIPYCRRQVMEGASAMVCLEQPGAFADALLSFSRA